MNRITVIEEKVRFMPRLKNTSPYEENAITKWFAQSFGVDSGTAIKIFHYAIHYCKASHPNRRFFLLFDSETREWHGSKTP